MFVDACAIVAILMDEPEASAYDSALANAPRASTSTLALFETILVLARPDRLAVPIGDVEQIVLEWVDRCGISIVEPVDPRRHLALAVAVAASHGVGKRHLSAADCFHYASAKSTNVPLLTLDRALRATDIVALP
jgi:ribonuclease VapC